MKKPRTSETFSNKGEMWYRWVSDLPISRIPFLHVCSDCLDVGDGGRKTSIRFQVPFLLLPTMYLARKLFSELNCVFRIITLQNLFVLPLSCRMAQPTLKCLFPISSSPPKKRTERDFTCKSHKKMYWGEMQRAWQQIKNQRKLYALHVLKWFIFATPETLECCQH